MKNAVKMFEDYNDLQKQIFDYFGYVEDWKVIPLDFQLEAFWILNERENYVRFANTDDDQGLYSDGNYYENEIYHQRFLPKWVYRGEAYTMICVDTHTDCNQFLQIFDNSKERH
jgi:hypothetical protein